MVNQADEPLRKVTLNLYEADVKWLQKNYGSGFTAEIRNLVRIGINTRKDMEREAFYNE